MQMGQRPPRPFTREHSQYIVIEYRETPTLGSSSTNKEIIDLSKITRIRIEFSDNIKNSPHRIWLRYDGSRNSISLESHAANALAEAFYERGIITKKELDVFIS